MEFEEEDGLDYDCGMTSDGFCQKVGSLECEWECPFNREIDEYDE